MATQDEPRGGKRTAVLEKLARMRQIKDLLTQTEQDEAEANRLLAEAGHTNDERARAVRSFYFAARLELYNQKSQIETDLLHVRAGKPSRSESQQVVELAQDLGLAQALRDRQAAESLAGRCWSDCTLCVTSCTECVTSCTQCVSLAGGGCAFTTLVASPCVPKPDVGFQPLPE